MAALLPLGAKKPSCFSKLIGVLNIITFLSYVLDLILSQGAKVTIFFLKLVVYHIIV